MGFSAGNNRIGGRRGEGTKEVKGEGSGAVQGKTGEMLVCAFAIPENDRLVNAFKSVGNGSRDGNVMR